ncbi:hypothetical protein CSKR_101716, partial [Clonorchis sinensis]
SSSAVHIQWPQRDLDPGNLTCEASVLPLLYQCTLNASEFSRLNRRMCPRLSDVSGVPDSLNDGPCTFASGGSLYPLCFKTVQSVSTFVIGACFIRAQSPSIIPPPDKSCLGKNVRRLAAVTSDYIQLFLVSKRKRVLLSLLDGEARDIVRDEQILKDDVFEWLRAGLTERIHQVEHHYRSQSRIPLSGKRLLTFFRKLRRMSKDAFPELRDGQRVEKSLSRSSSRAVLEYFPHSVASAFQVAEQVEDITGFMEGNREPNTTHFASDNIQHQHSRLWTPNKERPYHPMLPLPNRPYFRSTQQHLAPTNLPRWPTLSRVWTHCQRFWTRARTCGHNGPREFGQFRCVQTCTFYFSSTPPTVDMHVWKREHRILIDVGAACWVNNVKGYSQWCTRPFYGLASDTANFAANYNPSDYVSGWQFILGRHARSRLPEKSTREDRPLSRYHRTQGEPSTHHYHY